MANPSITIENMYEKEPTKNILNLLAFYHDKKQSLQQKHFLKALGNFTDKKIQSLDMEADYNRRMVEKFFGKDLKQLYEANIIKRGVINTSSSMTYYLNKLFNLGVIKKEGMKKENDYKNAKYSLNEEFYKEIMKQHNLELINAYNKESFSYFKIKPTFNISTNFKEMQEMFPDCSIFFYGLKKLSHKEEDFIESKFKMIEKIFSEIMAYKIEKLYKITVEEDILEKIESKALRNFFTKAKQETIQHFFMCLTGYFLQDLSSMNKNFFTYDHFYAWIYMIKKGGWEDYKIDKKEWEKYKEDHEKFFKIVKKYNMKDIDVEEALKLGVDMFYSNVPLSTGFSLFYVPEIKYNMYIKKITKLE